jgi:hypothetical protein
MLYYEIGVKFHIIGGVEIMKVIKGILFILGSLLVAQSFLSACPTCMHATNLEQVNTEKTSQQRQLEKQAAVTTIVTANKKTEIAPENNNAHDGYTTRDKQILKKLKELSRYQKNPQEDLPLN